VNDLAVFEKYPILGTLATRLLIDAGADMNDRRHCHGRTALAVALEKRQLGGDRALAFTGSSGELQGAMNHTVRNAARSVLAVLAGLAAMSAVSFAIEIPLRVLTLRLFSSSFPDRASLDTSLGWMVSQSLYTVPAAILGGYVAAWVASRREVAHAVAMAIVQELLIVALMFNPPHPVPPWLWAVALIVTPFAIICGGYLRRPRQGKTMA
jgi:hypothetical protein